VLDSCKVRVVVGGEEGLNIMEVGGGTKKGEHIDEDLKGTRKKKEEKPT
jgi:hypothetical protein